MVGVAEAGGGAAAAPESYYQGEYYTPAPEFFVQSPEMCPHPQHPQHPHLCIHADYGGGVGMGVVAGGAVNMPPMLLPPVMDEGMRHYMMQHGAHPPLPAHHAPAHQQAPHHQPPHHYAGANGSGPQQYYGGGGYPPPAYHHLPPPHLQPSPPPPIYHKDERTQRHYTNLKRRLDYKYNRNNGTVVTEARSGGSTPSLSPRKEGVNGNGGASGACSEGEGSSASTSLQGDEDDTQAQLDALSAERTPQVSEITPTSALVQWSAPPDGVPLPPLELTYELLLGDKDRYKAIYSGSSLSCRVRDLKPGNEYSLRLQIRAGPSLVGRASSAATFRAPPAPPGAPPAPRITQKTRSTILLRWSATCENGSHIINYVVEMDSGAGFVEVAQPRSRQFTASHLQMQTEYRFRVAAVNEVGRGEWSDEIVESTVGAPPTAPDPPRLLASARDSLHLAWTRRAENEEYTLQMNDTTAGHGYLPVYSGRDIEHVCAGLRRASDYHFRLRCETVDGNGPWSPEVTFRTAPERPGPPGRPTAKGKIHSRAFRLKWDHPVDNGGAQVRSYTLELDGGNGFQAAYSGSEREAHCDRLTPGRPYRARVCCRNEAGESDWSTTETVTTEPVCPEACGLVELSARPRATAVAVCWRPPETDGGAPITEYRLELCQPTGEITTVYTGLDMECTIRDLTPGTEYKLQAVAVNHVGAGAPSPPLEVTTAAAPPDPVDSPSVSIRGSGSICVEWSAPHGNGAHITEYRVEMSSSEVDDGYVEVYRGAALRCSIDKLAPASPYFFRVCASNAAGRGAWSRVSAVVTPRAPPAAPSALSYEATVRSLELSWRQPHDNGAEILRYTVEIDSVTFETDGPNSSYTADGLAADTTYCVRVAAVNELGLGDWSEPLRATTRPPPPPPPRLECTQSAHNFLKISWCDGTASDTLTYCLEMRAPDSRDYRPAYRGPARSFKVKKLREDTVYSFRIRATDELGGRGEVSEALEAATGPAPPPAPRGLALEPTGPRAVLASWEPLGGAASYVLQAARGKEGGTWRAAYSGPEPRAELVDLEPGVEYTVRVCGVRGGLAGAWSATARVSLAVPPAPVPRARRPRSAPARLQRHAVWACTAGFLVLAVALALCVEWMVAIRAAP